MKYTDSTVTKKELKRSDILAIETHDGINWYKFKVLGMVSFVPCDEAIVE